MKKLLIIMPVYNEENILSVVIQDWVGVLPESEFDLLLINDGPTDNSLNLIKKFIKVHKHLFLIDKKNSGHGASVIEGYNYAVKKNYQYLFQIDSDHQFRSNDFMNFWSEIIGKYDLIIGNRKKRKDPFIRVFISKIVLRLMILLLFFKNIPDANIPFRIIKVDFLKGFLNFLRFVPIAPNILMSIYSKKTKIKNIKHYKRQSGEISWSYKKLFKFGIKILKEILRFRFIN